MINKTVENFKLKDQDGNEFDLYNNLDKKILLAFYPKDNSPVCTLQLSDYRMNGDKFLEYGIKIIGINTEEGEAHKNFCNSLKLDFPLLIDKDKTVSKMFDALNFMNINKRKLVLIDTDKKIKYERETLSVFYMKTDKIIQELKKLKLL